MEVADTVHRQCIMEDVICRHIGKCNLLGMVNVDQCIHRNIRLNNATAHLHVQCVLQDTVEEIMEVTTAVMVVTDALLVTGMHLGTMGIHEAETQTRQRCLILTQQRMGGLINIYYPQCPVSNTYSSDGAFFYMW